jgi:hypothetical protein
MTSSWQSVWMGLQDLKEEISKEKSHTRDLQGDLFTMQKTLRKSNKEVASDSSSHSGNLSHGILNSNVCCIIESKISCWEWLCRVRS